jgi:hypothetical protein
MSINSRSRILFIVFAIVFVIAVVYAVWAATSGSNKSSAVGFPGDSHIDQGRVYGTVYEGATKLAGVYVQVEKKISSGTYEFVGDDTTETDGVYSVENLTNGTYRGTFTKDGYVTLQKSWDCKFASGQYEIKIGKCPPGGDTIYMKKPTTGILSATIKYNGNLISDSVSPRPYLVFSMPQGGSIPNITVGKGSKAVKEMTAGTYKTNITLKPWNSQLTNQTFTIAVGKTTSVIWLFPKVQ